MNRKQIIRSGNYISFMGSDYTKTVGDCVLEHHDIEEFYKTLIITWPIFDIHDENIPYKEYDNIGWYTPQTGESGYNFKALDIEKLRDTYDKIILYDMEHTGPWKMPWICDAFLNMIDEIWTPWLESLGCYGENQRHKVKFTPLRYCKSLEKNYIGTNSNPKYDLGFLGSMGTTADIFTEDPNYRYRHWVLRSLNDSVSHWVLCGSTWNNASDLIYDTKFMLDLSQRWTKTLYSQNIVRLQEMIGLGKHIITEQTSFNYFPDIVTIIPDLAQDLQPYIENHNPQDFVSIYRDMTYSDESYNIYWNDCIERYKNEFWDPWNVWGWIPVENKLYSKYGK